MILQQTDVSCDTAGGRIEDVMAILPEGIERHPQPFFTQLEFSAVLGEAMVLRERQCGRIVRGESLQISVHETLQACFVAHLRLTAGGGATKQSHRHGCEPRFLGQTCRNKFHNLHVDLTSEPSGYQAESEFGHRSYRDRRSCQSPVAWAPMRFIWLLALRSIWLFTGPCFRATVLLLTTDSVFRESGDSPPKRANTRVRRHDSKTFCRVFGVAGSRPLLAGICGGIG